MNDWRICWGAAALDATKMERAKIVTTVSKPWVGRKRLWFRAVRNGRTPFWTKKP